ncbi:hypothetical protein MESS2_1220014 [Mesorhizobium metallidurans STM 2683]|uniref:Uncharacterized protein n=1 Tax=Mesorhizobium metallidurans STM 2683 TaxID=1297569 RepID=M5EIF8_9HYPH|nr:hypothetical protein MESS2_1220014 [Mesorhizobium metallidurans STM 2683]
MISTTSAATRPTPSLLDPEKRMPRGTAASVVSSTTLDEETSAIDRGNPSLRHPRAKQGAKRRSADPGIHAVTSKRRSGPEFCFRCILRQGSRHGSSGQARG